MLSILASVTAVAQTDVPSDAIILPDSVAEPVEAIVQPGESTVVSADTLAPQPGKPTKYIQIDLEEKELAFFQGFTLSADLIGPLMYALGDYGSAEASLRLNLLNTFFPVAELGYGKCDNTNVNTNISYTTSAPFLRVGIDFNMLKDKFQDNRLYVGLRYGISKYSFDISGPELIDPIWGGSEPFAHHDLDETSHWFEFAVGAQAKITGTFHMGWQIRYKQEIHSTENQYARPYYIPGYGTTTTSSCWGATYSLIFDLNWGKTKKNKKVHHVATIPVQK